MPEKDELDLLLDAALGTYADPGPDAGLENRVMASLAAARTPRARSGLFARPRLWVPWAIALPVAAFLLLWIATAKIKRAPTGQTGQTYEAQRTPAPRLAIPIPGEPVRKPPAATKQAAGKLDVFSRAKSRAESMRSLAPEGCSSSDSSCASAMRVTAPKLIVFPTPQPLTAEEQTLLAAATRGSEAQRQALLESKPVEAPLSIASLNIPPLAPPDEGKN